MRLVGYREFEDRDLQSSTGVDVQRPHFVRVNRKVIHLGGQDGRILAGDSHGVNVGIDVSLDHQLPRPFLDGAKVTWLFGWLGWVSKTHRQTES